MTLTDEWMKKMRYIYAREYSVQFSSVQSLSRVRLFATPWIAARQASLSITNSQSSLRFTSIESVMPSSHLILGRPLLLLPLIPPSIRVFSNESTLRMRWPKYWSFSFSIIPSKEIPGLISFRMDWLDLLAVQGTLKSLLQHHTSKTSIFGAQPSSQSNSHIHTWPQKKMLTPIADLYFQNGKSLSRVWLFVTPRTVASLSMEFSKQECWSGLPFPFPGDLPDPGTEPVSLISPALAGRFFTTSAIRSTLCTLFLI